VAPSRSVGWDLPVNPDRWELVHAAADRPGGTGPSVLPGHHCRRRDPARLVTRQPNDPVYSVQYPPGNDGANRDAAGFAAATFGLDTYGASSTDGGATWSVTRLSGSSQMPNYEMLGDRQIPFHGDYNHVSSVGSFCPNPGGLDQDIFSAATTSRTWADNGPRAHPQSRLGFMIRLVRRMTGLGRVSCPMMGAAPCCFWWKAPATGPVARSTTSSQTPGCALSRPSRGRAHRPRLSDPLDANLNQRSKAVAADAVVANGTVRRRCRPPPCRGLRCPSGERSSSL
jgi:hypothetical protein